MNEIDQVLHRLAQADPAPFVEETHQPDSWTVLLDTIDERNGKMPRTTTPLWRRGPVVAIAVFALAIGAVAVFMSISPTDSTEVAEPSMTTQPAVTTVAPVNTSPAIAGVELPGPGEPWDMLIIAYTYDMGEEIPQIYAESAEQTLGVKVNLHHEAGIHGYAWAVLGHIGGGRYPDLSDLIAQAEIIVLQIFPENSDEGNETSIDADSRNCRRSISTADPQPPAPTSAEYWQPYRDLLDALYAEIWSLREGAPTVLISVDSQDAFLGEQREAGIEAECRVWYEAWSSVVSEAAADHGATMVSIYDVLNGTNHDLDPIEMGFLGATEQNPTTLWLTPNEIGAELVVDALAVAGFEPNPMP